MKTQSTRDFSSFFRSAFAIRLVISGWLLGWTLGSNCLAAELKKPGPSPSDALFDPSRVLQIENRLDPKDWHALRISHPDLDEHLPPIRMVTFATVSSRLRVCPKGRFLTNRIRCRSCKRSEINLTQENVLRTRGSSFS